MPDVDATVATRFSMQAQRLWERLTAKVSVMSGGSHTNAKGAVHNPHKMGYMAGGSSSGSAALVASGEVDLAIGGDSRWIY